MADSVTSGSGVVRVALPSSASKAFSAGLADAMSDLSFPDDYLKLEPRARELVYSTFPSEVIQAVEGMREPHADRPPGLLLEGLPTDPRPPEDETRSLVDELLLLGIGSIMGAPVTYPYFPACPVRDMVTSRDSSVVDLSMHRDLSLLAEHRVADVRLILGVRTLDSAPVLTPVCANTHLVAALTPEDVQLLRRATVWYSSTDPNQMEYLSGPHSTQEAKHVITGPEDDPQLNLYDLTEMGSCAYVEADEPEAVEAFHRVKEVAASLAEGVHITQGKLLILDNNRVTHSRAGAVNLPEGFVRWMKVCWVKRGLPFDADRVL